ncbi:MAG TPA: outer membrane beta-barrel domain-containing protein [Kofleriaceae bacterium]|nr:outer membrane beta-barrel domain-containing protein [Kofleriaceae bacterium]
MGRGQQALILSALAAAAAAPAAQAQPASSTEPPVSASLPGSPAAGNPARPSDAPVPSCLDQSIVDQLGQSVRPRGVQKRDFMKRGQVELVAHGGMFASDLLSTSYLYGGAAAFFLTEDLGIEASVDVTYLKLDLDRSLAEFFGDDRFVSGRGYLALGNLLWSPVHAKLKMGDSIVHTDFIIAAGGGRLIHDSVQGMAFDGGALLDMFLTRWITLRFDLRDVVLVQEAVGETRLTNNLTFTGGLGLWLPTGW